MYATLANLLDALDTLQMHHKKVIGWASPVTSFGDAGRATVATIGLNPSNREFVDDHGAELVGISRRFHTLSSLGLARWSEADSRDIAEILRTCEDYFSGNPYDRWFKVLDRVISGTGCSFYSSLSPACHLDLVPYATEVKWTDLNTAQRRSLLDLGAAALASVLRESPIRILILNGRFVVDHFSTLMPICFDETEMPDWKLARVGTIAVRGIAYRGVIDVLNGEDLDREILVLGYNHNLQSSFGVSTSVINAIRGWISEEATNFGVSR